MKLRNKRTGEIVDFGSPCFIIDNTKNNASMRIKNLAELNEEWEDYEEPKDIWWLDNEGCVNHASGDVNDSFRKNRKIGNYFKTEEEAEKAVEKLKAWKRLKDAGFEFRGIDWKDRGSIGDFEIYAHADGEILSLDLDLLFGGGK